jgi:hypothetical protein
MKMTSDEYRVIYISDTELRVAADMLAYSKDWPPSITREGRTYQFSTNEPMERWMAGEYSGHAKYIAIDKSLKAGTIINKETTHETVDKYIVVVQAVKCAKNTANAASMYDLC